MILQPVGDLTIDAVDMNASVSRIMCALHTVETAMSVEDACKCAIKNIYGSLHYLETKMGDIFVRDTLEEIRADIMTLIQEEAHHAMRQ